MSEDKISECELPKIYLFGSIEEAHDKFDLIYSNIKEVLCALQMLEYENRDLRKNIVNNSQVIVDLRKAIVQVDGSVYGLANNVKDLRQTVVNALQKLNEWVACETCGMVGLADKFTVVRVEYSEPTERDLKEIEENGKCPYRDGFVRGDFYCVNCPPPKDKSNEGEQD